MDSQAGIDKPTAQIDRSRRKILIGTGLTATAAILSGDSRTKENQPGKETIVKKIKEFTYDDLRNPDSEKFKVFAAHCAMQYVKSSGIPGLDAGYLLDNTRFAPSVEVFQQLIESSGGHVIDPPAFGITTFQDGKSTINLNLIAEKMNAVTKYPGIKLFETLVHEWGDLTPTKQDAGAYLRNSNEVITDPNGGNPEQWDSYRGAVIRTKSHRSLVTFDDAWNAYVAQGLVLESISSDPGLVRAAFPTFSSVGYFEGSNHLNRLIEMTGLSLQDMARLRQESNVEEIFKVLGKPFSNEALQYVTGVAAGGRNEEQKLAEKDFLIGKHASFLLSSSNWEGFENLLEYAQNPV